jgi:predicted dithiol-disulfide oxidoreductase (DUF899 family)
LVIYSYMFGPQRVAFAVVARSPIDRLVATKTARGWTRHKIYSDASGEYTRDYVSREDADALGYNLFTRRDGTITTRFPIGRSVTSDVPRWYTRMITGAMDAEEKLCGTPA